VLPMQAERDEAATVSLGVEREVLVDEVDAVPKIRELNGELLECLETADAEAGGAVEEKVLREDRVPPMELDVLKAFIELVRQGVSVVSFMGSKSFLASAPPLERLTHARARSIAS
jgi:hypothetical protein